MTDTRKYDIYYEECGFRCPMYEACPHCEHGNCTLHEPWFECDDFMYAMAGEISDAEDRITQEDEYIW